MFKNDIQQIVDATKVGKLTTLALFGAYAKDEGALVDGKPVNDLDLLLVDGDKKLKSRLSRVTTSVPLEVLEISSKELPEVEPTQMWWEISYAHIVLAGQPLKLPKWHQWEIPYWDAVQSLNKRAVSFMIAKHEMMNEVPNYAKVRTQIGKMIIALGDAILIKRGQFDHRYAVRSHMLMHDDIGNLYRLAVSWKILNHPETDPDQLWTIWNDVRDRFRDYVTRNQISVPNLDPILEITSTTEQEDIAKVVELLGGKSWL